MPRNIFLQRRSGRFDTTNLQTTVIHPSNSVRIYRFHNTRKVAVLQIKVGTNPLLSLAGGSSIDLLVPASATVKVGAGRGVYDLLEDDAIVRSGVIKGAAQIANLGAESRLYRIINSSDADITVGAATIESGSSADVVLTGAVNVTGASPEGVFEMLGDD